MASSEKKRPGRKAVEGLTLNLEKTLRIIHDFLMREGIAPSIHDLASMLGISGASAHEQLRSLERKGYIRRTRGRARSIEILKGPVLYSQAVSIPIIGKVAAGQPILAVENIIGEISVDSAIAQGQCFALEVEGDSMIEANIHAGNILIVRQQPIAENGDIVVAMLENSEATVKRLFIAEDKIELRPANTKYKPIPVKPGDELRILGKVITVVGGKTSTTKN